MSTDKVDEDAINKRLVLNRQIEDLFGSAFEDYQMDGIRYVAKEIERIAKSIENENLTGKIV